jgi:hypothetical protein
MNDDSITYYVEQQLSILRDQLGRMRLRTAVDPGGELARTDRMLRMKRGSRR